MIKLYLYDESGRFVKMRSGDISSVMFDVDDDGLRFTLQPPPMYSSDYKWNGSEWVKVETE